MPPSFEVEDVVLSQWRLSNFGLRKADYNHAAFCTLPAPADAPDGVTTLMNQGGPYTFVCGTAMPPKICLIHSPRY
jgi:hypothetical protein